MEAAVASNGPLAKPKRSAVACVRCRRYRQKCLSTPPFKDPCQNCIKSNVSDECYFPARGEVDTERNHRRKRQKQLEGSSSQDGDKQSSRAQSIQQQEPQSNQIADLLSTRQDPVASEKAIPPLAGNAVVHAAVAANDQLPSTLEITEAIESFSKCYFQISFLPQAFLLENIKERPDCISRFLLLSILTVSAQWTSSLTRRFGGSREAGEHFYEQAKNMLPTEMLRPTLQACQSFFLLSIYQWGRGNSEEASMLVAVSVRMLGLLGLHRESSYFLSPSASAEEVTMSEVARRSFWAIITHEHLASGLNRLASVRLEDIDTLLPGDESDFSFGVPTEHRPSLQGTIPHALDPSTATSCPRSLFASMVQSHALWAKIAQWACHGIRDRPWTPQSEFARLNEELELWYNTLPPRQKWSKQNLRGMLAEGKDIPFLSHITCFKLAGIVLRRKYLASMAAFLEPDGSTLDETVLAPAGWWQNMAKEMVQKSFDLIITIDDSFKLRAFKLGFAPILIFALYISGNVSLYLQRWPTLCPEEAPNAARHLQLALDTLSQLSASWPMAEAWHDSLRNTARNSTYNGWGALKAAAVAERSADESVGIFRHTNTTNPPPIASPGFSSRAFGSQSGFSATSISPEAIQSNSPVRSEVPTVPLGQPRPFPSQAQLSMQQHTQQLPMQQSTFINQAFSNPPQPSFVSHNNAYSQYSSAPAISAQDGFHDLSHAFINPEMPPIFPLTNEGIPYDAFEADLHAFFRGEEPSYLDSLSFGNQL